MKRLFVFVFICVSFILKSQQLCSGSSTTLTAATPASLTGQSYSMNPGGFSSPGGTFVVSPTVTTTYTLITVGTTTANTTGSTSIVNTVTVFAQPTVAPSYTQTTCTSTLTGFNFNLTFSPNGPVPSYSIVWAATSGTIPNVPGCITNSSTQYSCIGAITAGPYTATITSAGGCSVVVSFTINNQPAPATFSLVPAGTIFSVTCFNPSLTLNTNNPNNTYTWTSASTGQILSPSVALNANNQGSMTISSTNTISGCTSTKTISIVVNTTIPQTFVTPTIQNITCNLSSITTVTVTALSPTVNITHIITPPQGGIFTANTFTAAYAPQGGTGTYSYCLLDNANGCTNCKNFTVTSNQGYPTFSLTSSPLGFTLGCGTTSVSTVTILGANTSSPQGGSVSYSLLLPGTTTVTQTGTLSSISSYTVNAPGIYTVVTKDNSSFCESRIPLSIIQNTFGPKLDSVVVPTQILDCGNPTVQLQGLSETPNISYNWAIPGTPIINLPSPSLSVTANFTVAASNTLLATYTLTLKDLSNTCITTTTVPIYQNVFKPNVIIVATPTAISCTTPTLILTNQSTTGIPPNSIFPRSQPVIGFLWQGPSPQAPLPISTTYTGLSAGVYTLSGKDLNNGCFGTGTLSIGDTRDYPNVALTNTTLPQIDCGALGYLFTATTAPAVANATYTWTAPITTTGSALNSSSCLATAVGQYTLVVRNPANGCATQFTTPVVTQGSLTGAFDVDRDFGYAPLRVTFRNNSHSANNSTTGIFTSWTYGNGIADTTKSVASVKSTVFNAPGVYTVTAFVVKSPCVDTVTKVITVEIPAKLEIPNVFTPNGDNVNDIFLLHTANLSDISIKIFDRWGHKVYDLDSNTGNVAWDGKNQLGVECSPGTYFYIIKATGKDGQTWDQKGNISLFR